MRHSRALFHGHGTPSHNGYGQPYYRVSHERVHELLSPIDPDWAIVRNKYGVNMGTVDYDGADRSDEWGVHIRYFARPWGHHNFRRGDTGKIERKPLTYVECLDVKVYTRKTRLEDDRAAVARLEAVLRPQR